MTFATVAIGTTHAEAAPVTYSQASVYTTDTDDQVIDTICFDSAQCGGVLNVSGSMISYLATSSADQGILKVMGASSISRAPDATGDPGPYAMNTVSTAYFRDQWTIGGATAGTTGTLEFIFDITGSVEFGDVNAGVTYGLSLANVTTNIFDSDNEFPPYTGSLTTNFVFGQELDFRIALVAGSNLYSLENGGYDGQSSAMDLSHTATLTGLKVTDAQGNVVPFSLTTASNSALYASLVPPPPPPPPPTSVPEPASLLLSGVGVGLVTLARKRR